MSEKASSDSPVPLARSLSLCLSSRLKMLGPKRPTSFSQVSSYLSFVPGRPSLYFSPSTMAHKSIKCTSLPLSPVAPLSPLPRPPLRLSVDRQARGKSFHRILPYSQG